MQSNKKEIRMHLSLLRGAFFAVSALLLAMNVGAAESDQPTGPSIRPKGSGVMITRSIRNGSLESLRDIVVRPDDFDKNGRSEPVERIPGPGHHGPSADAIPGARFSDPRIVQVTVMADSAFAVSVGSNVLGVGKGFAGPQGKFSVNVPPPDTVGAVGATQFVQMVNSGFAVFDKASKAVVFGPVPTNSLWQGFGGACEQDIGGDATVVYDKAAKRWIVSQLAFESRPQMLCIAVSKTSDATAGWWLYAFTPSSTDLPDYPKIGVWPDAYYETANMIGPQPTAAKLCAYDRASMLTGAPARSQCFQLSSDFAGVLPSDLDGATPPPVGSPNYLVNFDTRGTGPTSSSLNLWKFHVDWANPAHTTLSAPTSIPVAAFIGACDFGGHCIKQMGALVNGLDSLGDRMMYRLAYRNFGSHESLVATHAIDVSGSNQTATTGVRWYEIRSPGTTPVVYQQSTYSPDATFRWMPSIAMDKNGDVAVGYSASGRTSNPSVRYAARLVSDPLNTLNAEKTMHAGAGAEKAGNTRWGDYSAMTIDPSDDCTFWYTNQYLAASGTLNWSTRIGSFKFPTCN